MREEAMSKKVSVIMGIYNCEKTLGEAIESIISQTYENWELIMCDDGSRDETYHLAQMYADRFPEKIKVIQNHKNLGLNQTLNNCLVCATGEYIARMDGDDLSTPERFEKEVLFLNTHPEYAIVSTPMVFFDEKGIWGQSTAIEIPQLKDFVFHAPFHCHAPCMIRREAFFKVGGYTVDPRLLRYEDCNLWYKLYSAGYRGYNLQEPLYMMRDDRDAYRRRSVESRLRATYVQWTGFRMVKMPKRYYPYLIVEFLKSVIIAVMPEKVYSTLHRNRMKRV